MSKILIVEGNIQEDNQKLLDYGIETHSESLKKTISNYTKELEMDVFNPSSEKLDNKINEVNKGTKPINHKALCFFSVII